MRLFEDVPMLQAWIRHLHGQALRIVDMPPGGRIGGELSLAPFTATPELIAAIRPVNLRACLISMAETANLLNVALRDHLGYSAGPGAQGDHAETIAGLLLERIHKQAQWLIDRCVEGANLIRSAEIGNLQFQSLASPDADAPSASA